MVQGRVGQKKSGRGDTGVVILLLLVLAISLSGMVGGDTELSITPPPVCSITLVGGGMRSPKPDSTYSKVFGDN